MSGIMIEPYAVIKPPSQGLSYRLSEFAVPVGLPQMEKTFVDRIEERLKALGMSAQAACKAASVGKDTIRNWQRKPDTLPNMRSLIPLAKVLGVSAQWIMTGEEHVSSEDIADAMGGTDSQISMKYGGKLEASAFRPIDVYDQAGERRRLDQPFHPNFPIDKQIAYEVVGDSMNAADIHEGMWVTAIDYPTWLKTHRELRDGTPVVVMRERESTSERELTVKEFRRYDDRIEFQPHSTNTTHRPIVYRKDEPENGMIVRIVAVVYWAGRDMVSRWR